FVQPLDADHPHREPAQFAGQQEHPVEDGRGEAVDVARDVQQRGAPPQRGRQPRARGTPLRPAPDQEVQGDRVQQRARHGATAVAPDRTDQPDREPAAALGTVLPLDAHPCTTSPVASRASSRWTRKRQRRAPLSASGIGSSATSAVSPGSSGCRNFTRGRRSGAPASPIASSTCSTRTTPGTTGAPGKWPASAGWSGATVNACRVIAPPPYARSPGPARASAG